MEDIKEVVKEFILEEFLAGEDPEQLTDSTSLIGGGFLDSISTLKLVSFLEERFRIETEAHEVSEDNLDSLTDIASFVQSKLSKITTK
ncbi:acyl carrier protein [candidate division KSB1 bacterium]|nr:acyl carrier protein [candidate division KSB1 bacterium]NIV70972.1 acyl carrier protein [Phycisphaerae bacterium]NIR73102.1 acyl carrier protein [candidate division KSB1 bacterium]NIT75196.1 acyl carrier protein [candidate division KSB1 bacterium]NIU29035.1 acyl carrier protein [candidate division KSB1 bacterium]